MNGLATTGLGAELLDDPDADPAIVRRSLGHITRANRWFGGSAAFKFGLGRVLAGLPPGRTLSIFDVGTGAGDLPMAGAAWARTRGFTLRPLGLDRSYPAAHLARENGVMAIVGCAGTLPLKDRSVDIVLVSQVIHHLQQDAAVRLILECNRVARTGVIVSDLERARLAMAGFWIGSRLLNFDQTTRIDGITSVRRGYSPGEFRDLFARAGMPAQTWRRPAFRLLAVWRPTG
ncbi:MAG: methyltransferase domain-containing protein [Gemmatimonadota bacterium]